MALQVTAYTRLVELPDIERDSDGTPTDDTTFYAHPAVVAFTERNWAGYTRGIQPGSAYGYAKSYRLKVGTCGHFNQWRRVLTRVIASRSDRWKGKPQPFAELFGFADNDGLIGADVARKLARDFAEWQDEAERFAQEWIDGDYWLTKYNQWRQVFETAADGGVVEFH